ncbi:glycine cleavage system protein GcvH [Chitiniphilus purpureus]|uniref:Glycine cleavage system H protein n=1 Tax=Chitiniphilus purpureus TaxID=2981137 RepID=A0ABY6DN37_9NEIS|nr:glycine cleavage system protein GcvH [Chitiniphilus sp. CD1]UXY15789.1 glycine cleavage system protein GcvH [Chitiniphilus sp. CD1]
MSTTVPAELKYVDTHEWLRLEADGSITVGITDHAQTLLGDVVYIDLPAVGTRLNRGDTAGVVESVKAASDVYVPIEGEVVAVNEALVDMPEQVNADPYGEAWFFRIMPADPGDYAQAMGAEQYKELIGV